MQKGYRSHRHTNSPVVFVLKGLIPYSQENLMLAFKPSAFFSELEKISAFNKRQLKDAYYQAKREKLFDVSDNEVRITEAGEKIIRPFLAKKLSGSMLLVIFDIPEEMAVVRAKFRRILKLWRFKKVQQSVWASDLDHINSVKDLATELEIADYVQLYESVAR